MAGSIQNRGNGRYYLTVSNGFDSKGKRIRKTRTIEATGIKQARKKLATFVAEVEAGEYIAPSHTKLKLYSEKQYLKHISKSLAPSTVELYKGILNNYINESIGHHEMDKISHVHINNYTDELEGMELSSSTIQKHHNLLNGMFKLAIRNDVISKNPMDKVDNVTVTHKRGDVYTDDEVQQFMELLNREDNKQMVLMLKLAVTTGMRRGELLALQWEDINPLDNTIHIRHSMSYTKSNGYELRKPKTDKSVRTISVTPSVTPNIMKELNKHKLIKSTNRIEASELWEGGRYFFVFSSDFGKPLFPSVPSRYFRRLLNRTGFKKIRFHDLRHTHVNYLMNRGAILKDVSKRLGHSSIAITVDVYGHLDRKQDEALADMFNDVL